MSASAAREIAPAAEAGVNGTSGSVWCDQLSGLVALYEADVNVVVLRRPEDSTIARFVAAELLPRDFTRVVRPRRGLPDLADLLPGQPPSPGYDALRADLLHLADVFAELTGADAVGLRLQGLGCAPCPRFHVDRVGVRMLCTYAGPGTEWLDHADVDRRWLGHAAGDLADEASGLIRAGARVHAMPPFGIGLLKGEAWPDHHGRGAVHRSPPLEVRGLRRVVATLEAL